jgi:hypothetical protein
VKIRIARALTKPTITLRGTNRMTRATPSRPRSTWTTPPSSTAATRYCRPWLATSGATTRATAPVAAEIIAGRPPVNAMVTAIVKEAKRPTRGSTPAMIENEIASGMSARATTRPASTSVRATRGLSQAGRGRESGEDMAPIAVVVVDRDAAGSP